LIELEVRFRHPFLRSMFWRPLKAYPEPIPIR
jgi:hypothetical protein